jgi:hypothetical protein
LVLRKESIGDPALIENLNGASLETACVRADQPCARRNSTMATLTPANIIPVGPPRQ